MNNLLLEDKILYEDGSLSFGFSDSRKYGSSNPFLNNRIPPRIMDKPKIIPKYISSTFKNVSRKTMIIDAKAENPSSKPITLDLKSRL